MSELQKFIAEQLKDPEFREAWKESRIEYEVARQLILLRKNNGLTQKQLAERLHTKQSEIARIENGNQNISLGKLRKIAEVMGGHVVIKIESTTPHELQKQ
jgi:transcriptional regulator with XRE-family HTH domain